MQMVFQGLKKQHGTMWTDAKAPCEMRLSKDCREKEIVLFDARGRMTGDGENVLSTCLLHRVDIMRPVIVFFFVITVFN